MSRPGVPTLGYSSRREAVLALRQAGETGRQIASQIGIAEGTVSVHLRRALQERGVPTRPCRDIWRVSLDSSLLAALGPAARTRGISPADLARWLLHNVVDGKLIDAVLDDS